MVSSSSFDMAGAIRTCGLQSMCKELHSFETKMLGWQ